jgi:hypothetical protein
LRSDPAHLAKYGASNSAVIRFRPRIAPQKAKSTAAQNSSPPNSGVAVAGKRIISSVVAAGSGEAIFSQSERVPASHQGDETLGVAFTRRYPHM